VEPALVAVGGAASGTTASKARMDWFHCSTMPTALKRLPLAMADAILEATARVWLSLRWAAACAVHTPVRTICAARQDSSAPFEHQLSIRSRHIKKKQQGHAHRVTPPHPMHVCVCACPLDAACCAGFAALVCTAGSDKFVACKWNCGARASVQNSGALR